MTSYRLLFLFMVEEVSNDLPKTITWGILKENLYIHIKLEELEFKTNLLSFDCIPLSRYGVGFKLREPLYWPKQTELIITLTLYNKGKNCFLFSLPFLAHLRIWDESSLVNHQSKNQECWLDFHTVEKIWTHNYHITEVYRNTKFCCQKEI